MNAHRLAEFALFAVCTGAGAGDSLEPSANLNLHMVIDGPAGVQEPAKNVKLHFNGTDTDRSTDENGDLKVSLEPGPHTLHALAPKLCHMDFTVEKAKNLELTVLITDTAAGQCVSVPSTAKRSTEPKPPTVH